MQGERSVLLKATLAISLRLTVLLRCPAAYALRQASSTRGLSDSDSSEHTPRRRVTRHTIAAATAERSNSESSSEPSDVEDTAAAADEPAGRRISRGTAASASEHVDPSSDGARVAAVSASASASSPALSREVRALTFVHRGYGLDEATIRANALAAQQRAEAEVIARRQARHAKRRRINNGTVGRKRTSRGGGIERENSKEKTGQGAAQQQQPQQPSTSEDDEDAAMRVSDDSSHSEHAEEEVAQAAAAAAAFDSSDESRAPSIPVGTTPKARARSAASARARARAAADSPVSTRGMRYLHRQPLRRARSRRSGQYTRDHSKTQPPRSSSSESEEGEKKQDMEGTEEPTATAATSPPARRTRSHAADAKDASSDPENAGAAAAEGRDSSHSSSVDTDEEEAGAGHSRPLRAAARKSLSAVSVQLAAMHPKRKRRSSSHAKEGSSPSRRNRHSRTEQSEVDENKKRSSSSSSSSEDEAPAPSTTRSRSLRSTAPAASSAAAAAAAASHDADDNDDEAEGSEEDEESGEEERSNDEEEEEGGEEGQPDGPARAATTAVSASTTALRRKRGAKRRRVVLHPRKKSAARSNLTSGSGLAGLDEVEALLRTRGRNAESPPAPAMGSAGAAEFLPASAGAAARPFSFQAPSTADGSAAGGAAGSSSSAAGAAASAASSLPQAPRYKCVNRIREGHGLPLYFVAFNTLDARHKDIFASAGTNRVTVYRALPSGAVDPLQLYVDEDPHENYYTLVYSIDLKTGSALLLVAGENAVVRVIDLHSRKVVRRIVGHGGAINELKIHPLDLALVASASKDMSVRLWNLHSGCCVAILAGEGGHKDEVLSVDFAPDGNRIVSAGTDHQIMIWDISGAQAKAKMRESFGVGTSADTGDSLAAPLRVLSPFAPLLLSSPVFRCNSVHSNYVDHARFLGGFILSKSTEARITLWTTRQRGDKAVPLRLREFEYSDCDIWYMRFAVDAPQQRMLGVGNKSGAVFVWRIDDPPNTPPRKLTTPASVRAVRCVAFSSDAKIILAACEDGSIFRWDQIANPTH